jgi:putative molybdopterin biosynthesis protein
MAVVKEYDYPEHVSLEAAAKILIDEFSSSKREKIELEPHEALGLILASDVISRRNVPHYTASAMDGYALSAATTAGATAATPVIFKQDKRAQFSWVNTGNSIQNADAVVMVEDTSLETNEDGQETLKVFRSLTQGENVRAVGEDVMNGQLLACRGDRVTPALISLFLCAGVDIVSVYKRPRTLFIPTGNEILTAETWLSGDKTEAGFIVDSNSVYAKSIFEQWGFELDVGPILPDDPEIIADAVSKAVSEYDLVLVSAGSAKGKRDHSAEIFSKFGKMLFRYVRMKPGRPAMAADIGGKPVICSPGFPMSCAVTLWSLIYPLLRTLSGDIEQDYDRYISEAIASNETVTASLMSNHSSPAGVSEWLRMKCARFGEELKCWPLSSGASVLWALAESDGMALLPESSLELPRGTGITIRMARHVDFTKRLLFQGSDDPAVGLLVSLVKNAGMELVIRAVGSMGGLAALGRGDAHFAAAHLLDATDGSYNTSYINQFANGRKWKRRLIFHREQGIIVRGGNPKNISSFADLASGRVVFENRQPGAGTRVLLDYMLKENGLNKSEVPGYERISITHLEAANKVASGVADATLGIKAAADALDLAFIPVALEPYELVFGEAFDEHPASRALIEAIESDGWREAVRKMGGYYQSSAN